MNKRQPSCSPVPSPPASPQCVLLGWVRPAGPRILQPDKASCPWEPQHLPPCHVLFSSEKSTPRPRLCLLPGGRRKDSQADSPGSHQPPPCMLSGPPHLPQQAHPSHQRQKVLFPPLPEMSPPPPSHQGLMTDHPVVLSCLMS